MSTKAEVLARMADVANDEIVAVPTIYTKAIAEELYEYANGDEIELTNEQWVQVVEQFENCDYPDDEALVETIENVIADE